MREAWTDERLDDLANRMDRGFDRVDAELRALRGEMNERFDAVGRRFDAMQRTLIVGFASIAASVLGGVAAVAAGHLL